MQTVLQLDVPAAFAALCATMACALLGNFLVLRRQSLMGDAISHAVLPGIVVAFLVFGSRTVGPMFFGASLAAILAVVLIELLRRYGRLDYGTAMGVIFSIMFAAGVVMMEQAAARNVDLDADCVLYGQLEHIIWLAAKDWTSLLDRAVWLELPRQIVILACALGVTAAFVVLFWKELKISSFDPDLATALGFSAGFLNLALMVMVGIVAIAAFEAVGSILVIAMFICPAASARLWTDRLIRQVQLSQVFAVLSALGGYVLASFGPYWLGLNNSVAASGMIAVFSGFVLVFSILFAPRYGIIFRNVGAKSQPISQAEYI